MSSAEPRRHGGAATQAISSLSAFTGKAYSSFRHKSASTYAGDKNLPWWKRWNPFRVFRGLAHATAGQDFRAIRTSLQLFPLRFRDPDDEQTFYARMVTRSREKLIAVSWGVLTWLFLVWALAAINVIPGYFYTANHAMHIAFHAMFAGVFATLVLFAIASKRWLNPFSVDWILRCLGSAVYVVPNIWVTVNAMFLTDDTVEDGIILQKTKLWNTPLILGLPLFGYIFIHTVTQHRTSQLLLWRVVHTVILFTLFFVQGFRFAIVGLATPIEIMGERQFYYAVSAMECAGLLLAQAMCFGGRWAAEVQERVEFWKLTKSQEQLASLRERARREKKRGSTAVEDLLNIIIKAVACIQDAILVLENPLLTEALDNLRAVEGLLTQTDNIYAVRLMEPQKTMTPTEEGAMEAQYIRIYGAQFAVGGKHPLERHVTTEEQYAAAAEAGKAAAAPGVPSLAPAPIAVRKKRPILESACRMRSFVGISGRSGPMIYFKPPNCIQIFWWKSEQRSWSP